jgi:hypothetical protein
LGFSWTSVSFSNHLWNIQRRWQRDGDCWRFLRRNRIAVPDFSKAEKNIYKYKNLKW